MTTKSQAKTQDAITLLTDDHKKVQKMFKDYEKLVKQDNDEGKDELAQKICAELTIHAQIEEELVYSAAREVLDETDILDEAEVEHDSAKELISQIEAMQAGDELFDAKVTVLGEYVNHHIKEEQGELFPKLKKSDLDLEVLGDELEQRKTELIAEMGMEGLLKTGSARQAKGKSSSHKSRSSH